MNIFHLTFFAATARIFVRGAACADFSTRATGCQAIISHVGEDKHEYISLVFWVFMC
jgi:hypothetical protein